MGFLSIDSPIMRFLGKIADLMIVNVLTIICSIPIFTIGPALTAAHYVCLKIVRKEEGYVIKNYFKAFKENFKQATVIWLILLAIIIIGLHLRTMANTTMRSTCISAMAKYSTLISP